MTSFQLKSSTVTAITQLALLSHAASELQFLADAYIEKEANLNDLSYSKKVQTYSHFTSNGHMLDLFYESGVLQSIHEVTNFNSSKSPLYLGKFCATSQQAQNCRIQAQIAAKRECYVINDA